MTTYRKYFSEGLNADMDFELLKPGEWINASNIRMFTTDKGATGRVEAVGGTARIFNHLPAGTNQCIGGCADDEFKRIVWFNHNSNGDHGIYCFDKVLNYGYPVLLDNDITGGLNFSLSAYIHSCFIANGSLYWTNSTQTQPRRINISAGIRAYDPTYPTTTRPYSLPVSQSTISWIRRPGGLTLLMQKVEQETPTIDYNYIRFGAFQFAYRYNFRDFEFSTLSPYTNTANYNTEEDGFNAIDLFFDANEKIQQDVQSIDLVARNMDTQAYIVIKTWDKNNPEQAAQIANHNTGTVPLQYRFYNTTTGYPLDDVYKIMPFHTVPIYAETTEVATDRSFMANYTAGYDTPIKTSLDFSFETTHIGETGIGTYNGTWVEEYVADGSLAFTFYFLRTQFPLFGSEAPPGPYVPYYFYKLPDGVTVPPYPSTVDIADLTYVGTGSWFPYYKANGYLPPGFYGATFGHTNTGIISTVTGGVIGTDFLARAFKSGGNYQLGIVFYDEYMRACGVKTSNDLIAYIPDAISTNDYATLINWTLNNANALQEIPAWAHYYAIVITKCLTTRFFLQGGGTAVYVTQDINTNEYDFTPKPYSAELAGIAIDISSLLSYKMGYSFAEGDIAKILVNGAEFNLAIKGTFSQYAILELVDAGALSPTNVVYEFFTPYKTSDQEPFFETGVIYKVTDPTTDGREYSEITGAIPGDIYLFKRSFFSVSFTAETMSPNDKFWKQWHTNAGRPNFIDTIGQQTRKNDYCFSDIFQAGTKNNGLSSFTALNTGTIDGENGPIRKTILANKVQLDGSILLMICENETVSCYLGEQEIFDTQGSAFVARASSVVGSAKSLRGSMGTRHPESAFENNGLVYFYDQRNGAFVHYSNNGLFPISQNNFVRPANLFSKALAYDDRNQAIPGRVIGGFDPYHKEALFSIPYLGDPPKGNLLDYDGEPYPYDIWDAQAKTLMYKQGADRWIGSMSFQAEKMIAMDNELYSFKEGCLYIHNQGLSANFYGEQFTTRLMFAVNPGAIHSYMTIGLEGAKRPVFTHFRTEDPNVQSSDLVKTNYVNKQGIKYATMLRDRFSPNVTGSYIQKQFRGDRLIGKALLVMLVFEFSAGNVWDDTFDDTFNGPEGDTTKLALRFVDVGHIVSAGHLLTR